MKRRTLLSRLGGTAAVTATAGCLTGAGGGTTTGPAGEAETASDTATAAASATASDDADTDAEGPTDRAETTEDGTPDVQFGTAVEGVAECSKTCRTLTYSVQNHGTERAPDVTVRIQVFTGGNGIWKEEQEVGTIDASSERTGISRDIDVGILGGRKIKENDGKVVIELTPQSEGVAETFTYARTLEV